MIFSPQLARMVLSGKKTQTRRKVKPADRNEWNIWVCRYRAGRDYSVQPGRGKNQLGRITIVGQPSITTLGELTLSDAKAEGFRTRADFARYWLGLHSKREIAEEWSDEELLERFFHWFGGTRVWRIEFAVNHDEDLFLRVGGHAIPENVADTEASERGYTTQHHLGMSEEGPSISLALVDAYSAIAHSRDAKRLHDPIRRKRDEIARLLDEMTEALPSKSGTVRDSVRRLQRELQVLDRKLAA